MAVTQISDIVVPEVFEAYISLLTAQRSAFIQSGVLVEVPLLSQFLAGGGQTVNVPNFNDLADTEANVSSDNPASSATPGNITTGTQVAIRQSRNQTWGSMDLAAALAGPDPLEEIASKVAGYWIRQRNRYLIASSQGLIADNIANDGGDMVNDITNGVTPATSANLFSAEAFIDTLQTMGESGENLTAIAVHSVVYRRMQKNNLIDFIPDARGEINIPTFLGRFVVVDDTLPVVANGPNFEYSSYLYGGGSWAAGNGSPLNPVEVERSALAGDGGGQEILVSRQELIIHPVGYAWLSTSMAGASPDISEMQDATNWNRVFPERRQVVLAELRTNG